MNPWIENEVGSLLGCVTTLPEGTRDVNDMKECLLMSLSYRDTKI